MWFLQSADQLHVILRTCQGDNYHGYNELIEINKKNYYGNFPPNPLIFINFLKFLNLINTYRGLME